MCDRSRVQQRARVACGCCVMAGLMDSESCRPSANQWPPNFSFQKGKNPVFFPKGMGYESHHILGVMLFYVANPRAKKKKKKGVVDVLEEFSMLSF